MQTLHKFRKVFMFPPNVSKIFQEPVQYAQANQVHSLFSPALLRTVVRKIQKSVVHRKLTL